MKMALIMLLLQVLRELFTKVYYSTLYREYSSFSEIDRRVSTKKCPSKGFLVFLMKAHFDEESCWSYCFHSTITGLIGHNDSIICCGTNSLSGLISYLKQKIFRKSLLESSIVLAVANLRASSLK